jgi:hypothetical protein
MNEHGFGPIAAAWRGAQGATGDWPPPSPPPAHNKLPLNPAGRKEYPIASGLFDYFPDALTAIAHVSFNGNQQHNPGEPLHWARGKSDDHADTMQRHFLERGQRDTDGQWHAAKMAWRALAILQLLIEKEEGAPAPPGAK